MGEVPEFSGKLSTRPRNPRPDPAFPGDPATHRRRHQPRPTRRHLLNLPLPFDGVEHRRNRRIERRQIARNRPGRISLLRRRRLMNHHGFCSSLPQQPPCGHGSSIHRLVFERSSFEISRSRIFRSRSRPIHTDSDLEVSFKVVLFVVFYKFVVGYFS